jgi:hypothetical protein
MLYSNILSDYDLKIHYTTLYLVKIFSNGRQYIWQTF